jgi:hypothetical protein
VSGRRGAPEDADVEDVGPVNVLRTTSKAALVETSGGWRGWVPFSTIHEDDLADVEPDVSLESLRVVAWFVDKNGVE